MRRLVLILNLFITILLIFGLTACQKDPVTASGNGGATKQVHDAPKSLASTTDDYKAPEVKKEKAPQTAEKEAAKPEPKTNAETKKTKTTQSSTTKTETVAEKSPSPSSTTKQETTNRNNTPPKKAAEAPQVDTVTVSIVGDNNKTSIKPTKVTIKSKETVLEITVKLIKKLAAENPNSNYQISVQGSGASAYVEGINNLYQFDKGPNSGWTVQKNGVSLTQSAGITSVQSGDTIQWLYTTNWNQDE